MPFSALILTLNEESCLPRCLKSICACDDVVVFDSFSVDRTVEIANASGARVIQRKFDNYASKRNAALHDVEYKHPWALMPDADECMTPELREEIMSTLAGVGPDAALFRVRYKNMFLDRWIKGSSGYPTW